MKRWHGCTTESLRWQDLDYDVTAGHIELQATDQPDSSQHLFFVDMRVTTNDGRVITLERIEGGKLLHLLMQAQADAQDDKPGGAVYYTCKCVDGRTHKGNPAA